MKIIFNSLNLPFEFWNMRYKREVRSILCFIKHISTHIYREREKERERSNVTNLYATRCHKLILNSYFKI
jgi:hypothetical protein